MQLKYLKLVVLAAILLMASAPSLAMVPETNTVMPVETDEINVASLREELLMKVLLAKTVAYEEIIKLLQPRISTTMSSIEESQNNLKCYGKFVLCTSDRQCCSGKCGFAAPFKLCT